MKDQYLDAILSTIHKEYKGSLETRQLRTDHPEIVNSSKWRNAVDYLVRKELCYKSKLYSDNYVIGLTISAIRLIEHGGLQANGPDKVQSMPRSRKKSIRHILHAAYYIILCLVISYFIYAVLPAII